MGADISMAIQVKIEELEGIKSYFAWILGQIDTNEVDLSGLVNVNWPENAWYKSETSRELCRLLFETDFYWSGVRKDGTKWEISEDEIRAKDALEIRKKYAEEVGHDAGKSDRDIDRIWKSIHGKCSVLELIYSLCLRLDQMVNEDEEPGKMVGLFFKILIHNLALDDYDDEDFDHRGDDIRGVWKGRIKTFLNREYFESGCNGGLFPLHEWKDDGVWKDQKTVGLWYQMNTWLNEHLDENCNFLVEKF